MRTESGLVRPVYPAGSPSRRAGRSSTPIDSRQRRCGCWSAARRSSTSASPIARVSLTSADVADAMVTSPNQLLVNGKMPGTISMFVWDRAGGIRRYEVVVQRDLARLNEQMKQLFPGESIDAQSNGTIDRALGLGVEQGRRSRRRSTSPPATSRRRTRSSTCCRCARARASNQVLLRVRFAEVSRSALTELGASLFTGADRLQELARRAPTTQQFSAGAGLRQRRDHGTGKLDVQRLPEPVPVRREAPARHGDQGAADQGPVPEPRRAEPRRRERQGSELPRRRRVPDSDRAGLGRRTVAITVSSRSSASA